MSSGPRSRSLELLVTEPAPPHLVLASPAPGWFRPTMASGELLNPGGELGELEILGQRVRLLAPRVRGVVSFAGTPAGEPVQRAVGYGDALATLDPNLGGGAAAGAAGAAAATPTVATGLVFRAPTSGRFYTRSAPGKPAFVTAGDVVGPGQTLCLLEVMKTFNRVTYGGPELPERARVAEILVKDEDDVAVGDALLRLEELP